MEVKSPASRGKGKDARKNSALVRRPLLLLWGRGGVKIKKDRPAYRTYRYGDRKTLSGKGRDESGKDSLRFGGRGGEKNGRFIKILPPIGRKKGKRGKGKNDRT